MAVLENTAHFIGYTFMINSVILDTKHHPLTQAGHNHLPVDFKKFDNPFLPGFAEMSIRGRIQIMRINLERNKPQCI